MFLMYAEKLTTVPKWTNKDYIIIIIIINTKKCIYKELYTCKNTLFVYVENKV